MLKYLKEKMVGFAGSISGIGGVLGSWQVCHNVCLILLAFLSLFGITLNGMPLFFLTKIVIPLWVTALILLGITLIFYLKKKCISKNLIIVNTGLIITGIPFQSLQKFSLFFWIIGGIIILFGVYSFFKDKLNKTRKKK